MTSSRDIDRLLQELEQRIEIDQEGYAEAENDYDEEVTYSLDVLLMHRKEEPKARQ